jgi:hypothetical protein
MQAIPAAPAPLQTILSLVISFLGNIGALASKPVMEGKSVLFKKFADVNCIDLCVDC